VEQVRSRLSFTARLTLAYIVAILLTTLAAGVPAYLLVSSQLDAQARAQLTAGERAIRALVESTAESQTYLARLISQRPTLWRLASSGDLPGLEGYLAALLESSELDALAVVDLQGRVLAGRAPGISSAGQLAGTSPRVLAAQQAAPAILVVIEPLLDPAQGTVLAYVSTGRFVGSAFCRELSDISGYQVSVLQDDVRIASSLPLSNGAQQAGARQEVSSLKLNGARYLAGSFGLPYAEDDNLQLEVALPIDPVLRAQRQARFALVLSTAAVALVASLLAGRYARRITSPLRALTVAAEKIGLGDFSTPVPQLAAGDEIATLALALEESRLKTRRVMDELSQSMAWSQTLIQSISEGIVTVDHAGLITSFNQGAERILGYDRTLAVGRALADVIAPLGDRQVGEILAEAPTTQQLTVASGAGTSTTLLITSTPFSTADGKAPEIALVLRDVTEQEALQHLRSYFLANISHEFRTPLSALNASVELMLSELDDLSGDEVHRLLSSVHMSVTGLQTLIDNLLESASIEAGKFAIHRQATDLEQVLRDASSMLQPLLDRRGQRVEIDMDLRSSLIFADPTRITQVLVNLLSNASKYGPIGAPIEVQAVAPDESMLRVNIADHGPGLAPAERSTIFRRFVRLRPDQSAQYGIGLGLHVVKAIVEEHGGQVGVDARPGGGSIFWFSLPRRMGNKP